MSLAVKGLNTCQLIKNVFGGQQIESPFGKQLIAKNYTKNRDFHPRELKK